MIASIEKLQSKDCTLLGKLLIQNNPDLAIELLAIKGETDLSKLKGYYHKFCGAKLIDESLLKGALYKTCLIEKRRLFIAVILSIYKPHTRALKVSLSNLLKMDKSQISKLTEEITFHYKTYSEFKVEVDIISEQIREV